MMDEEKVLAGADDCPKCDKCGAPITTGFMVFLCPQREQCEFFEADWDDETKAFVRSHWGPAGQAGETGELGG